MPAPPATNVKAHSSPRAPATRGRVRARSPIGPARALEDGFQRDMAAVTSATSSSDGTWEHTIWTGLQGHLDFLGSEPGLARIGLIESFAVDRDTVLVLDRLLGAFTVFLAGGYEIDARPAALPRLGSEAIAGAIWETLVDVTLRAGAHTAPATLPDVAYIALAPFLGPAEAHRKIEGWMRA
jgi:hypothetical protein